MYYILSQRTKSTSILSNQDSSQLASKQEKSTEHGYRDVDFAKKMILVNQQAMQIAELGSQKTSDMQIKELASKVYASSESNSQAYIVMLNMWNETYFNLTDFPEMEGNDMYPTFPGMMKLSDVKRLNDYSGSSFNKAFLELMIKHHEGVTELQTVKMNGESAVKYADILKLREEYAQTLQKQIEQMKQHYKTLGYGS